MYRKINTLADCNETDYVSYNHAVIVPPHWMICDCPCNNIGKLIEFMGKAFIINDDGMHEVNTILVQSKDCLDEIKFLNELLIDEHDTIVSLNLN